jgi:hypothetical protein
MSTLKKKLRKTSTHLFRSAINNYKRKAEDVFTPLDIMERAAKLVTDEGTIDLSI